MPAIGAIIKSGAAAAGKMAASKAKDVATQKAKDFVTGKKKGKGGGIVKNKVNKEIMGNMMGRKIGGDRGGVDIPASKQTINVTPLGSDSAVGSGGGSGDVKIVQDISVAVSAIADTMRSGLVLKDKQETKKRRAREKDKRAAQENEKEAGKPKKEGSGGGGMNFKVPGVGLLGGIFGFVTKFVFASILIKLVDFAPKLKGVLNAIKGVGEVLKFIFGPPLAGAGLLLQGLISFVDIAYKLTDGAEKIVKNIFGEEGAEKFRTFIENFKTLINSFVVFKILKGKFGKAISQAIKNAYKLVKNFIKRGLKLVTKLFPNLAKGASKLLQVGKGLASKGLAKVGGFASKIFGKAAKFIAPGLKGALPAVKGFAGRIPILGPIIVGIVSLMSGEPAAQALFKAGGAALGGALGTFIPIPILGTLIGETIGVFVGDLLYELIMGGGISAVGQKLKDTFMTLFKGGKAVVNWLGGGIKAFINNVLKTDPIKVPEGGGVRSLLTRGTKNLGLYGFLEGLGFAGGKDGQIDKFINPLNLLNPFKFYPLLFKSFFGKRDEGEVSGGGETATITPKEDDKKDLVLDDVQGGKNGDADQVAKETTYEEGTGGVKFIPVPVVQSTPVLVKNSGGGSRSGSRTFMVDETELALYGGK